MMYEDDINVYKTETGNARLRLGDSTFVLHCEAAKHLAKQLFEKYNLKP